MLTCIVATSTCEHSTLTLTLVDHGLKFVETARFFVFCPLHLFLSDPWTAPFEHEWVSSWRTYTELKRLRCVSTTWSHHIWKIAAGYERRFRNSVWQRVAGCHEGTGADPHCQCGLCREFLHWPRPPGLLPSSFYHGRSFSWMSCCLWIRLLFCRLCNMSGFSN